MRDPGDDDGDDCWDGASSCPLAADDLGLVFDGARWRRGDFMFVLVCGFVLFVV